MICVICFLKHSYSQVVINGTPSSDYNYIRTISMRAPYYTLPSSNYLHSEEIKYFDDLGRPRQTIQVNASPNGKDIVKSIVYDQYSRISKDFLAYVVNGDGTYKTNDTLTCKNFYKSSGSIKGRKSDSKPFCVIKYDNSPMALVNEELGTGIDWHTNNKKVTYNYTTNSSTITSYNSLGSSVIYPANSLYVVKVADQNGNVTIKYKDKLNRVLIEERIDGNNSLKTHFIYNENNLLHAVIPPLASSLADTELCYFFTYDKHNRLISKKIPGAQIVYMIYDKRDRLVLMQDGNLRNNNQYLFTKYDQLNRPIMTGKTTIAGSLNDIRNDFQNHSVLYETFNESSSCYGYTRNNSYPNDSKYNITKNDVLTVTWYDNYKFIDVLTSSNVYDFSTYPRPNNNYAITQSNKTKNLITGSLIKPLLVNNSSINLSNKELVSVFYFDKYGNVIKTINKNHKDGYDILQTRYEPITSQILESSQIHTVNGQNKLIISKGFTYDHIGRLLEMTYKINNEKKIVLKGHEYNELGELVAKKLHSTNVNSNQKKYLQKIDYSYNIRGWLSKINDCLLSNNNDLFGMQLYYNDIDKLDNVTVPTTSQQYNGNISAVISAVKNDDADVRGYGFIYDNFDRLKKANYAESANLSNNKGKYSVENITYDKNGNLKTLNRKFNSANTLADQLTYNYYTKSNKLKKVVDPKGDVANLSDYVVRSSGQYTYDNNGNMIFDPGKNVSIKYNHLNLPECIIFNSGKIFYHYDAVGTKLSMTVESNNTIDKKNDYIGNIVYHNNNKSFIKTEEGRIIATMNNNVMVWKYEYTITDHLGNARVSFTPNSQGGTDITQSVNYYPFGMVMTQKNYSNSYSNYTQNDFLYNGKEHQNVGFNSVNLDWYDYGARFYDASIGRWHTTDPMAEKFIDESPYCYVGNSPQIMIDPDGMAYKPTKDDDGNYNGFTWVEDEEAYDEDGNLKDGFFEKAILFTNNGTWSQGRKSDGRYLSYNIGSATVTLYDYIEEYDEKTGITEKSALIYEDYYDASTRPSDPDAFGEVASNTLLQAVKHKHAGRYNALGMRTLAGGYGVPANGTNPSNGSFVVRGANIHKAGRYVQGAGYSTGTFFKQKGTRWQNFWGPVTSNIDGSTTYGIYKKKVNAYRYSGVSEGCFLIKNSQWNRFMQHFPVGVGKIGVIKK